MITTYFTNLKRSISLITVILGLCIVYCASAGDDCTKENALQHPYLSQIADDQNVSLMREHAWKTFLKIWGPNEEYPAWKSWPVAKDVFAKDFASQSRLIFEHPPQLLSAWKALNLAGAIVSPKPVQSIHFNGDATSHIRHCGLYTSKDLETKRQGNGFIRAFPRESIVIKAVWWPVKQGKPSPMPVWDGIPSGDHYSNQYPYSVWSRLVVVSPLINNSEPITIARPKWWYGSPEIKGDIATTAFPLGEFAKHDITDKDLLDPDTKKDLDALFLGITGEKCDPNDLLVLVAMHVATKELDDWVWMTFWWHDKADAFVPPELHGRPARFRMDVIFSATTPRETDGHPKRIYNPWLEAPMENGVDSNCISCHRRSVWCVNPDTAKDILTYPIPFDSEYFRKRLRLDYSWTMLFETIDKTNGCP